MTHDKTTSSGRQDSDWEAQVNDLLDGELDEAATVALRRAAAEDQELARVIIGAYELQRDMERLGIEEAPRSLKKKLRKIPRTERSSWRPRPWVLGTAMASLPVLALTLVLMQPQQPSQAEVEQARRDLAVAFTYIDKVGSRTGGYVQQVLGTELQENVTNNISRHIPYTENNRKEKTS
jgi:hypothetical protein